MRFAERFVAAGETLQWIAKDTARFLPTNDFVWTSNRALVVELKSTKARYTTIRGRIEQSVTKAQRQGVVKENFLIDIGDADLTSDLRRELGGYNAGRRKYRITRLWVMSRGRIERITLQT